MEPANVGKQVQAFEGKWKTLRPLVPVVTPNKYRKEGLLMDGVHVEICKSGSDDDSFMVCPLRTTSLSESTSRESWKES
eukprot:7733114-Prorocentrum_lima.AAC.1